MNRRPLFAMAMGFVLGEVCAWRAESGRILFLMGLPAFLALEAFSVRAFRRCPGRKKGGQKNRERQKKGRGVHGFLWILLLLCIFFAGYGRMAGEIRRWKAVEERLWEDGEAVDITGKLLEIREKEKDVVLTVKTQDFGKLFVYADREEEDCTEGLRIGERVNIKGEVGYFREAKNPGEFDVKGYYASQGILTAVFAWEVEGSQSKAYSPYLDALYRCRLFCSEIFGRLCEPEDEGIFRAAILGEKEGMDREIRDLYQKSGIAHLLAISGLHLSLLGAGLHKLLRKCGMGYGLSGILAAAAIGSYAVLTGASGSAVRAVVMLGVSFLAAYLGRTYDLLSALSLAALLLAGAHPFSITQSGFQLSFGAVLGIGILGKALGSWLGMKKPWMQGFAVSLSVQMATAPVVLWHYFQIPVYAVFLNLAVVPLMSYVVISGLLGLLFGSFLSGAGVMAVGTGHYILQFYQYLCEITSRLPGSLLIWGRPEGFQIFLYYLFLAGMLLGLAVLKEKDAGFNEDAKKKRGGMGKRRLGRWGLVFAGTVLCGLSLRPLRQSGLDIAVLDVGQGDGIVLIGEGGRIETEGILWQGEEKYRKSRRTVILMDGGSSSEKRLGENRLEPYLKSEGISRIDFAIVSHGDEDHSSGLCYLLGECPEIEIGALILPEAGMGDPGYKKLIDAAKKRDIAVGYMDAGDRIRAGECCLNCFYPGAGMEADFSDRNQQSLVIRADYQDFHMLFTGDVGQEGERMALKYAGEEAFSLVQVLKAAHHGSRFSSGEAFLAAVHPNWTVISYGEGNSYGHPHEETLERLRKEKSTVLETGKMGAILLHVEKGRARYYSGRPVSVLYGNR